MARLQLSPDFDRVVQEAAKNGLVDEAESIADEIVRTAPVDTGTYRDSIQVFSYRYGVGVETTDEAGHIIEWGSVNMEPLAPMRNVASQRHGWSPA